MHTVFCFLHDTLPETNVYISGKMPMPGPVSYCSIIKVLGHKGIMICISDSGSEPYKLQRHVCAVSHNFFETMQQCVTFAENFLNKIRKHVCSRFDYA
ncbi:hypothetical protein D3C71_151410 [compost metagenome]